MDEAEGKRKDCVEGSVSVTKQRTGSIGDRPARPTLLEQVLNKKRLSLLRSPEVVQFLQKQQQLLSQQALEQRQQQFQGAPGDVACNLDSSAVQAPSLQAWLGYKWKHPPDGTLRHLASLAGKHTDLEGLGFGWSSNFWLLQSNELTFGLESTRGMLCSVGQGHGPEQSATAALNGFMQRAIAALVTSGGKWHINTGAPGELAAIKQ
ncbi:Regulatory factor X-associated protein [Anas platyrhynchos]|uniref:Regulatory factor X-associated protein n=1 Tax=Anas platyrhynchos TaxID=8839 RepID=R0L901_ANAPL|nr:Regulatory factor X-associated protein [Anas platyrhynchos]